MDFLNLSFGEFAALAGVLSAAIVALYLMDRSKRRQVVATLRFWTAGHTPEELKHKRRIHQPWSLLLQLLSILLLLAAIAEPYLGDRNAARDHVLVLDTSAWMGARARQGTLLDQAKAAALAYVDSVAVTDRVMLVRADALATPVTQFETNRVTVQNAIRRSQPSTSALNLEQALEFAQQAQRLQAQKAGEIIFAGAGRISRQEADSISAPSNLRLLSIPSNGENVGLRKLGLRRAGLTNNDDNNWEVFVGVRNDGVQAHEVAVELQFAGSPAGSKILTLAPGAEAQPVFPLQAKTAGLIEARVRSTNGRGDAFPQDDRAAIELPAQKILKVMAYTNEPELLKPLFTGKEHLETTFSTPASYEASAAARSKADIVILDHFTPAQFTRGERPVVPTIWIEPPSTDVAAGSPFSVKASRTNVKLESWRSDSPLTGGLYTKDVQLASTEIFGLGSGDEAVAESADGPVIVARSTPVKMVALGFHPLRSSMKYDLATPLLIANILRWMAPDIFRRSDVQAGTAGTVSVPLEKGTNPGSVHVLDQNQHALPFTIEGDSLRFFSGSPGNVRVVTGDRETNYSLTLPDVGDVAWTPPGNITHGIPRSGEASSAPPTLWPWLALAGAIGILGDWLLYGRSRITRLNARVNTGAPARMPWRKAS